MADITCRQLQQYEAVYASLVCVYAPWYRESFHQLMRSSWASCFQVTSRFSFVMTGVVNECTAYAALHWRPPPPTTEEWDVRKSE
jgi:hypothetical protein